MTATDTTAVTHRTAPRSSDQIGPSDQSESSGLLEPAGLPAHSGAESAAARRAPDDSRARTRHVGALGSLGWRALGLTIVVALAAVAVSASITSSILFVIAAPIVVLVGAVAVWLGVRHPVVALGYFLVALFFRLAMPGWMPVDPFLPAFAGLMVSAVVWAVRHRDRLPRPGGLEIVMVAYVAYNVVSAILPHEYSAGTYIPDVAPISIWRLILSSTVMPFTLYLLGRTLRDRVARAEAVLWMVLAFGAYSAAVSIGQFHMPSLVWPSYIVSSPNWVGRANGVFNQPVVNGMILVLGFAIAMVIVCRSRPVGRTVRGDRARRGAALVVALTSAYAVYLTHTRIIYLALAIVIVMGVALARGARLGFAIVGVLGVAGVAANWSTFTSSDRAKGGVGSTSEVLDRLNTAATSFWAFDHKPLFGWGLGRFVSVNTLHHQQWSSATPFERGLGIASHFNELGILADLGLAGLAIWLVLVIMVVARLCRAYAAPRPATEAGDLARSTAFLGMVSVVVMITAGTSVDLRLFDFPVIVVFLLVGLAVGVDSETARVAPTWTSRVRGPTRASLTPITPVIPTTPTTPPIRRETTIVSDVRTRILRRWWVIALTVALAVGAALAVTLTHTTEYSSKAALTTYSEKRAPEQDAVLIQSYVDYFNNGANRQALERTARIAGDVSFSATPVATGPIMFITASGENPSQVRTAVTAMANAFRDSINDGVQRTRESAINALRRPFLDRVARRDFIIEQERVEVARQVDALNADTSGRLQNLTDANTVTAHRRDVTTAVVIAVVVGLLVGAVLAWLLGGVGRRISSVDDLRDALGIRAFDLASTTAQGLRLQTRHVSNALAFEETESPTILTITGLGGDEGCAAVGAGIAGVRSAQGADVVVINTIRDHTDRSPGIADFLRDPDAVTLDSVLRPADPEGRTGTSTMLLTNGDPAVDIDDVLTRDNVATLIDQLSRRFSMIVVVCPPISRQADVGLFAPQSHRTLVVAVSDTMTASAARESGAVLDQSQIEPYAALLVSAGPGGAASTRLLTPGARVPARR